MNNISYIGEYCVGCGTCSISCPKQCIKMEHDINGFLKPIIDESFCIECGVCTKYCPATKAVEQLFHTGENKYYSAISNNSSLLENSSSGGLFALFAEQIITRGGYVCGCIFDKDTKTAKHILSNSMDDVKKMCGSKYVQSVVYNNFRKIKELLISGREVLFTGTACQIAGLRLFLESDYSNLILVEVLCHGTPSPQMFSDFINYWEKKVNGKVTNIKFRDKCRDGWGSEHRTSIVYTDENHRQRKKFLLLPAYFSAFFYGLSLRESCYECQFARIERVSDITIGDFWGAWKKYNKSFYEGISIASINTDRGCSLMMEIRPKLSFVENLTLDEAIYSNDNFQHPVKRPQEREDFFAYYRKFGYKGIWKKTYLTKTYRKKTIISFYGALVPKRLQKFIQWFRRGGRSECQ